MQAQRPQAYAHSCTFMFMFIVYGQCYGWCYHSSRAQMGVVYCFTALRLSTPPKPGSCEQEGAGAAFSGLNNHEIFQSH